MSVTGNGIYAGGGGGVEMVTVDITGWPADTWYIPSNGQHVGETIITPSNSIIVFSSPVPPVGDVKVTGDVRFVTSAFRAQRPGIYLAVYNAGESGGSILLTQPAGAGPSD